MKKILLNLAGLSWIGTVIWGFIFLFNKLGTETPFDMNDITFTMFVLFFLVVVLNHEPKKKES